MSLLADWQYINGLPILLYKVFVAFAYLSSVLYPLCVQCGHLDAWMHAFMFRSGFTKSFLSSLAIMRQVSSTDISSMYHLLFLSLETMDFLK